MITKLPPFLEIKITRDTTNVLRTNFPENFPPNLTEVNLDNCDNIQPYMKRLLETAIRTLTSTSTTELEQLEKLSKLDLTIEDNRLIFIENLTKVITPTKADPLEVYNIRSIPLSSGTPRSKAPDLEDKQKGQTTRRIPRR